MFSEEGTPPVLGAIALEHLCEAGRQNDGPSAVHVQRPGGSYRVQRQRGSQAALTTTTGQGHARPLDTGPERTT